MDVRPKLNTTKRIPIIHPRQRPQTVGTPPRTPRPSTYANERRRRLAQFQRYLQRQCLNDQALIDRIPGVLAYFGAQLATGVIRSQPISPRHRAWMRHAPPDLAALELFRLAWFQHVPSVVWTLAA